MKSAFEMTGTSRVIAIAAFITLTMCFLFVDMTNRWLESEREQAVKEAVLRNQARVQTFEQYALRVLEVASRETSQLSAAVAANTGRTKAELSRILQSRQFNSDAVRGFFLAGKGREVASSSDMLLPHETRNMLSEGLVRSGTPYWLSPPFKLPSGDTVVALVGREANARVDGMLVAILHPHSFTAYTRGANFEEGEMVSLIGLDGITRSRRNANSYEAGSDLRGRLVMQQQFKHPNGTYEGEHAINGDPYIFSHRRLSEYGVFVTSGMRRDFYLEHFVRDQIFGYGALAALILLAGGAFALLTIFLGMKARQVESMQDVNRRLQAAQRLGNMGDWEYDVATDRIFMSENLMRAYDTSREYVDHGTLIKVMSDDDFAKFSRVIETVRAELREMSTEIRVKLADGSFSYRRIIARPELDEQGRLARISGLDQCIDNERRLRELQAQSEASARLQSMSALTATLAHEVNQPLTVIANYLSVALHKIQSSRFVDHVVCVTLRKASDQVLLLGEMIASARGLASDSDHDLETYSLLATLDEALELIEADPKYDATIISVEAPDNDLMTYGRRALTKQVFYNLLKNSLEVTERQVDRYVDVKFEIGNDRITAIVSDNGPGFPAEMRPFEAFSSQKHGGLGLGLALSRTIIEAQGGHIWMENTNARGATICFDLPKDRRRASSSKKAALG